MRNTEKLIKLRDEMNEIFNGKIEKAKVNSLCESVDSIPVTSLYDIFPNIANTLMESKGGRAVIKKYIKTITESKSLRPLFTVHSMIKSGNGNASGRIVSEAVVKIVEGIDNSALKSDSARLRKIVKEGIKSIKTNSDELDEMLSESKCGINKPLSFLAENAPSHKNLFEWAESVSEIEKYVNENRKEDAENITESAGQAYGGIMEIMNSPEREKWEKEAIMDICECSLGVSDEEEVFGKYVGKCMEIIEEKMEDVDVSEKARLNEMKQNLSAKKYNKSSFSDDIMKLSELSAVIND